MPRSRPLAAPDEATLRSRPLHEIVRDWPETLAVLRRLDVEPAAAARPLADAGSRDADAAVEALLTATAWRGQR